MGDELTRRDKLVTKFRALDADGDDSLSLAEFRRAVVSATRQDAPPSASWRSILRLIIPMHIRSAPRAPLPPRRARSARLCLSPCVPRSARFQTAGGTAPEQKDRTARLDLRGTAIVPCGEVVLGDLGRDRPAVR